MVGSVVAGRARLEYGPGRGTAVETHAGDFVHVPPGTVRRVVDEAAEDWIVVVCFVGTGPPFVDVDGPAPA